MAAESGRASASPAVAEVEHRWSNLLQILLSVIAIRRAGVRDEEAHRQLRWVQEMVKALASLQRPLMAAGVVGERVDLAAVLRAQAPHWNVLCEEQGVVFTLEAEQGIDVSPTAAMGLCLAVVELVFNCCKHAFPEARRGGTVLVRLRRVGGGAAVLSVEDDGVGLPSGQGELPRDGEGAGAGDGLRLLRAIAAQAGAEAAIGPGESGRGTAARLRFAPLPPQDVSG